MFHNVHGLTLACLFILTVCFAQPLCALDADHDHDHDIHDKDERRIAPKPPKFSPAPKPVITGEFLVGVVVISFRDTEVPSDIAGRFESLGRVSVNPQYAELGSRQASGLNAGSVSLEKYFKQYSNEIAWPKLVLLHDDKSLYQDPHLYGYYCEYDYWHNPVGWHDREEGAKRVRKMNERAMQFARKSYRGEKPRFVCYNYMVRQLRQRDEALSELIADFYANRDADPHRTKPANAKNHQLLRIDPKNYYRPVCRWGEPMWPNSKIQINDFNGSVMAHEIGHCLGAPDVYRVGRYNDGIGGSASLLAYGPTANAFSRFYHHAYISQKNHPGITKSGTYTLHPRHITPKGNEALGYLIASNHPHYMYHVEYIHGEDGIAGVGPKKEGMLISVVNLGLKNYLGSPDYFYVYRPDDPFFRGEGELSECLFGTAHKRTEFNMNTEPSSRLPNLMDGGISISNIHEKDGTLTFDLEVKRAPIKGTAYTNSMLPQIRLDTVRDVRPTSFAMDCTIKFRGEPLITTYGFCWSKSSKPTIRDETYTLAHRECYRGHAIDLRPGTTYYVRAFANNGVGIRYSDEEITVTTPEFGSAPEAIAPLCTDYYAPNRYLHHKYRLQGGDAESSSLHYSPTCVLAQLIAYYRPRKFEVMSTEGRSKDDDFDFDQLSWNPSFADYPKRLEEVDRFFRHVYQNAGRRGFLGLEPGEDFLPKLKEITGFRSRPVLSPLAKDNQESVARLIREDLVHSRPAFLILSSKWENMRWAMIDGVDEEGKFHVNFPYETELEVDGMPVRLKPGYYALDSLIFKDYATQVVTSCYDK